MTPIASDDGPYESLPAAGVAESGEETPPGAVFKPANCRPAVWSGPDPKQFGKAASTVVAFRKPGDSSPGGVQAWDELVASTGQSRQAALGNGPVAGCATVRVSFHGKRLAFEEKPASLRGVTSRAAVLTPPPPDSRRTRVVTFIGNGYVGVVFMQGPVAEAQVNAFASAAYQNAAQKLG